MANLCRWQKIGGGVLWLKNKKRIKPKEIFLAYEEDIPEAFKDCVVLLEENVTPPTDKVAFVRTKKKKTEPVFIKQEREDGLFDVIDQVANKILNEEPLTEDEADQLLYALEG